MFLAQMELGFENSGTGVMTLGLTHFPSTLVISRSRDL